MRHYKPDDCSASVDDAGAGCCNVQEQCSDASSDPAGCRGSADDVQSKGAAHYAAIAYFPSGMASYFLNNGDAWDSYLHGKWVQPDDCDFEAQGSSFGST